MTYGTVNADVIGTSVAGSNLGAGNASTLKNRIINGAMVIDQRNAGASVTATGANYSVDRWVAYASVTSKFTVQQNAGSVTPPVGFSNYLGATSSSAYTVGASEYYSINQAIEGFNTSDLGWGTANAKNVTLSAWVYSSLTGTFGGAIQNYARNRSYPFSYSIPVANTWTQISITIAGDTSGTWVGASNAGSMYIVFSLGTGSTISGTAGSWSGSNYQSATGAISVVGTSGATFYITGVQLEVGSSATGFEYRQYGQELQLCQRYFYQINSSLASYTVFCPAFAQSASKRGYGIIKMNQTMRAAPTLTQSGTGTFNFIYGETGQATNGAVSFDAASNEVCGILFPVASSPTQGYGGQVQANATTSAYLGFSAEL